MKVTRLSMIGAACALIFFIFHTGHTAAAKGELKDLKQRASYAMGLNIGQSMKSQAVEIDVDVFLRGLKTGLSGGKADLSEKELQDTMMEFRKNVQAAHATKMKKDGEANKKKGEAYLAKKKKEKGVKALPSGLLYKVVTPGKGKSPAKTDTVVTHYKGTLIDGTQFDSSYDRKAPATFRVDQVIAGWTEALQLMKVGGKWELYIPGSLAYGERGSPPKIGPNETLVFTVELQDIKKEESKKEAKK